MKSLHQNSPIFLIFFNKRICCDEIFDDLRKPIWWKFYLYFIINILKLNNFLSEEIQ